MPRKVSYAQNGEDIRVWRAFQHHEGPLRYVDVGANEPRHLSITASLSDLGWRGLLIEADPALAAELRAFRPHDTVVECAASDADGTITFHLVPGTGLGTLNDADADAAAARGFETRELTVRARPLTDILDEHPGPIHFMSIDVEGAEATVLRGLDLTKHRPWVLCVEAVEPGTDLLAHEVWEPMLTQHGYRFAAFDGVNRWYVADEHAELAEAVATPFNALDAGTHGWVIADHADVQRANDRAYARRAWQRELIMNDLRNSVPTSEYEKQIVELRTALSLVEASRSWRYTRKAGKAAKIAVHKAKVATTKLPGPVQRRLIQARHLRHVNANFPQLTDPAYLGHAPQESVDWITPDGMPPLPPEGAWGFKSPLGEDDRAAVEAWLAAGPYDDDEMLDRRMDNHDDELGRVMAALRTRLRLATPTTPQLSGRLSVGEAEGRPPTNDHSTSVEGAREARVLVDVRSLQSSAFGARGIGRFAAAALLGVREALGDDRVVLLVDRGLERLPADLAGDCEQVTRVTDATVARYSVLVQPSPMTASADPLLPLLHSDAHKVAVVFDFIPMHYPTVYLRHAGNRAEYAANLDALRCYDEFVCISHLAKRELTEFLNDRDVNASVAWPASIDVTSKSSAGTPSGPIVVMTGDEPRKNTYGALAAIGAATAGQSEPRDVLVIGMAGQATRVHHWSIHAAMRPGEAVTAERLTDAEMHEALRTASVVMVPSFDEGLSLPVIEAVAAGANVIASDIPAHRELIGPGGYLFDPKDLAGTAKVIRRYAGTRKGFEQQQSTLARHQHDSLEASLARIATQHIGTASTDVPGTHVDVEGRTLRLAFATPWTPQPSGVADFSATIGAHLHDLCDLTVFTTSGAEPTDGIRMRGIDGVLADPRAIEREFDAFVTVVGNSHFHIPFLQVMQHLDTVAVLHDTRMVEYYMALRGKGGVEQLMLRGTGRKALRPSLDEQIDDMRLLENAGLWEIAQRARALVMHSPCAAPMVAEQTGVTPDLLPFASQRVPDTDVITDAMRQQAKTRLGWDDGRVHLASFGYVDIRTKMADLVVEAAAWLQQWGHPVALHLAGKAQPELETQLDERAGKAGLEHFEITGFLTEAAFRDHLLAVDLGVQLRVSPLLGVSGPLSDLAAWGTPAVASTGLAIDVDTPAYVDRLPDEASPLMVAEAIERRLAAPKDTEADEAQRQAYLQAKSPRRYAEGLLGIVRDMI